MEKITLLSKRILSWFKYAEDEQDFENAVETKDGKIVSLKTDLGKAMAKLINDDDTVALQRLIPSLAEKVLSKQDMLSSPKGSFHRPALDINEIEEAVKSFSKKLNDPSELRQRYIENLSKSEEIANKSLEKLISWHGFSASSKKEKREISLHQKEKGKGGDEGKELQEKLPSQERGTEEKVLDKFDDEKMAKIKEDAEHILSIAIELNQGVSKLADNIKGKLPGGMDNPTEFIHKYLGLDYAKMTSTQKYLEEHIDKLGHGDIHEQAQVINSIKSDIAAMQPFIDVLVKGGRAGLVEQLVELSEDSSDADLNKKEKVSKRDMFFRAISKLLPEDKQKEFQESFTAYLAHESALANLRSKSNRLEGLDPSKKAIVEERRKKLEQIIKDNETKGRMGERMFGNFNKVLVRMQKSQQEFKDIAEQWEELKAKLTQKAAAYFAFIKQSMFLSKRSII